MNIRDYPALHLDTYYSKGTATFHSHSNSLRANPLARSPEKVKLDSDKWKLSKNLFE
jgi:hypothetical protein